MESIEALIPKGWMHERKGNGSFKDCFKKEGRMEKTFPVIPIQDDDDSEASRKSRRQTNPFLIANVLETIFPYLDHATLKSCRTVSRLWSALSSPLIYHRSKISLEGPFTDARSESFLRAMQTRHHLQNPTLPMSSVTFNLHHAPYSSQNLWFFQNFSSSITSLTIQAYALQNPANAYGTKRFLHALTTILLSAKSLTSLTMTHLHHLYYDSTIDSESEESLRACANPAIRSLTFAFEAQCLSVPPRRARNCMTLLGKLLAMAPQVRKLHTEYRCSGETFLYFLMTLRDVPRLTEQLEEFTVNGGPFDNYALALLNEMAFPRLKLLRLNTLITKREEAKFYQFLEKLSPTLESLIMFGDRWGKYGMDNRVVRWEAGFSLDFPPMPKLKLFRHQNYEGLRLGGDAFLTKMPALEEIVVRDFAPSLGDVMLCPQLTVWGSLFHPRKISKKEENPKNMHVKKVTIDVVFVPLYENLSCIHKVLGMFPNLQELEMAISFAYNNIYVGRVLEILGQGGVNIKRLKITFYQCNELRSVAALSSCHYALANFVANFRQLHKLDFILEDLPVMSRITLPLWVVKGMMNCKTLTVANFTGFSLGESPEETETCARLMDDKLAQWTVKEQEVPFPHFSCFDY